VIPIHYVYGNTSWLLNCYNISKIYNHTNDENFETQIWIMFDIQNQMPHITQISDLPRCYCIDTCRDSLQKGD